MSTLVIHPGLAKCGSTTIQEHFGAHPSIRMFRRNIVETESIKTSLIRNIFKNGRATDEERREFEDAACDALLNFPIVMVSNEGLSSFTKKRSWSQKADLIQAHFKDNRQFIAVPKKCFFMVRSPWRFLKSTFYHQKFYADEEKKKNVDDFLDVEARRVAENQSSVLFADIVCRYIEMFGADMLLVASLDELIKDRDQFFERINSFLGISGLGSADVGIPNSTNKKFSADELNIFDERVKTLREQKDSRIKILDEAIDAQRHKIGDMGLDLDLG